jgi:hypothetical protein
MDMTFGTWNIRSLYWAGALETISKELPNIIEIYWEHRSSDGTVVEGHKLLSLVLPVLEIQQGSLH